MERVVLANTDVSLFLIMRLLVKYSDYFEYFGRNVVFQAVRGI